MDTESLHVHQFQETVVHPTCKENGYTLYTCQCGYEYKANFKPAGTHSFQVTETTPATCEEPGSATSVCTACGKTQTRLIPPLGHDYGEKVVKAYPTCQEPGIQIRKCHRCTDIEESTLAPTGHMCAPKTARYDRGRVVEFFCENCGQTIRPVGGIRIPGYRPTKFVLILTIFFSLLEVLFKALWDARPGTVFHTPWLAYSLPFFLIAWNTLLLLKIRKIKQSARYFRCLSIFPLIYAIGLTISMAVSIVRWNALDFSSPILSILWSCLPQMLRIAFFLALAILFFARAKKRYWLFFVVLSLTSIIFLREGLITINYISLYMRDDFMGRWFWQMTCASAISNMLLWLELTMLVRPCKKSSLFITD